MHIVLIARLDCGFASCSAPVLVRRSDQHPRSVDIRLLCDVPEYVVASVAVDEHCERDLVACNPFDYVFDHAPERCS